jgi:hypothetical protein
MKYAKATKFNRKFGGAVESAVRLLDRAIYTCCSLDAHPTRRETLVHRSRSSRGFGCQNGQFRFESSHFLGSSNQETASVEKKHMAAFCSCCGAEINLKAEACPVCGTPRHGMLPPGLQPGLDIETNATPEDAATAEKIRRPRL